MTVRRCLFAADQRLRGLDRELQTSADIDHFALQLDAALGDPGHVQQVVEQASKMRGLSLDDADERPLALVLYESRQQLRGVGDRRDRIAQLVREHGEKLVFAAIGVFQRRLQATLLRDVLSRADYMVRARCEHRDHEMAVGELTLVAHGLALLDHQLALLRCFGGAFRHDLAQSAGRRCARAAG